MRVHIQPGNIGGVIVAPASKSAMQRACAAALLAKGVSVLKNPGKSKDDLAAIDTIQRLGATIVRATDGSLQIQSNGIVPKETVVHCGESGLGIRMFTPLIALYDQAIRITGEGSLITRPMDFFDAILPQLQVDVQSNAGKLPLVVKGPLQPKNIEVDGSLSSQFLTGLIMAYAGAGADGVTITVKELKSKPYIDLTLHVLSAFGSNVTHNDHEQFHFHGSKSIIQPATYTVEGDWSGGAFLLVAGALAGETIVKGLDPFSTQADKAILHALMDAGVRMSIEEGQITVRPSELQAFQFDATDCPDLFPPLVALAVYCQGTSVIQGVSRLAHKESNRGLTLQEEFGKMGAVIKLQDDLMIIEGGKPLQGAAVHSRHDHRIAMACAVAALKAEGETSIDDAEAINKSYPDFYDHLQHLGAHVMVDATNNS
ncbi:MAG: 3-phosphoshikimate 1-carboxyvinyltransferase [Chitinophagales bacterium]|nr:3-phosphoshikimate 1-carboxyvinyltransferase [Chitinophagales bacterium]